MRTRTTLLIGLSVLCAMSASVRAEPLELKLWPGLPPGETGPVKATDNPPPKSDRDIERIYLVNDPVITVFRAPEPHDTGTAVVVCPGGGYRILAHDLEGTEVATWLNSIGVTAVVLKYRVPCRDENKCYGAPLQDAQRALRLTRQNAARWGIDPERIGILGFSAGGHVSILAGTHWDRSTYPAVDAADDLSPRPDFLVPIYPAYLTRESDPNTLDPLVRITDKTPPTFIAVAQDDGHLARDSALLFIALKDAGVTTELHIYSKGGHGYGLRPTDMPATDWPDRVAEWMRASGLLEDTLEDVAAPAVVKKPSTTAAPDPAVTETATSADSSTDIRRVTVTTAVQIKTNYDETANKTTVSTGYIRFKPGNLALTPNLWMRLVHAFPGKTRPESVDAIELQLRFLRSGGRNGGRKGILLDVDGKRMELPVTGRDEDSKLERRPRKTRRIKNETLRAQITLDHLTVLSRAKSITLLPEELALSREQLSLFPALLRDVTGK